jgi:hypothetical protein
MIIISYTVIFHTYLYACDMFHILLSCDSFGDLWNVCMYVYMYAMAGYIAGATRGTSSVYSLTAQ